jgi:hypothetical protein
VVLSPAPAGKRSFPTLSLQSLHRCLDAHQGGDCTPDVSEMATIFVSKSVQLGYNPATHHLPIWKKCSYHKSSYIKYLARGWGVCNGFNARCLQMVTGSQIAAEIEDNGSAMRRRRQERTVLIWRAHMYPWRLQLARLWGSRRP